MSDQDPDTVRYRAPSARDLARAVERIAPRDTGSRDAREPAPGPLGAPLRLSPGRARQLWMVVGMWNRALERGRFSRAAHDSSARLFTQRALREFWELAEAEEPRTLAPERGRDVRLPLATPRIVRDCLRILAALVRPGEPVRLPVVARPALKDPVPARSLTTVYRGLADMAASGPLERGGTALSYEDRARLLAMVAIVLDSAARSGELAALRRLGVRRQLLAESPLSGGEPGLWVTLVLTRSGPPGITLRPQGLTQAYARGMRALNDVLNEHLLVGSSADNAAAESFNAAFKRLQGRKGWSSERGARLAAFRWLHPYNTVRRHSHLGHRSPIAYETALDTPSTTPAPAVQNACPGFGVEARRRWRRALAEPFRRPRTPPARR